MTNRNVSEYLPDGFTACECHRSVGIVTVLLYCVLCSLTRVGLVLVFLQYVSELGFHIARLFYFTDENHQKMCATSQWFLILSSMFYFFLSSSSSSLTIFFAVCVLCRFDMWAVSFVFTRMATLTLMFLAVGFGLARSENQGLDLAAGNFNTVLIR